MRVSHDPLPARKIGWPWGTFALDFTVMKLPCALLALGLALMPAGASEIEARRAEEIGKTHKVYETGDGRVYRDVTVTSITDAGISIRHAEGTARLGFERLSAEQREQFGITREGAAALLARERNARAAYEAHLAAKQKEWQEKQQQAREELLARQAAARLEAQREPEAREATSIVSVLEVPRFPIIRGSDNQILYPIQSDSRPRGRTYSGSSRYYPIYAGGFPCYGAGYHPGHSRGYSGWLSYRRGNFTITTKW